MKILVLSVASWDDRNSVGNTLSNWFDGLDECEFACMFSREAMPDNRCCNSYFQTTFGDIIHNIFTPWRIGRAFKYSEIKYLSQNSIETSEFNQMSGFRHRMIKLGVDLVFKTGIWLNRKSKQYIRDFNPDIIFLFTIPDAYRYTLTKYLKENTKAKIVQFIADDVYGQSLMSNSLENRLYRMRIPKMLGMADKIYGASEQVCKAYNKWFDINASPLYKGCNIGNLQFQSNRPLKMIYAGNLYFGREKSLITLVQIISFLNKDEIGIELSIYSNSFISNDVRVKLDNEYGCHLYSAKPYDEIRTIMSKSDIVLHVESFEEQQKQSVRYSFSTKIIDCLQSGAVMMAIGPKGIASIEYEKNIPGTIVVDDLSKLQETIISIMSNPDDLLRRATMIHGFAKEYHEINEVRRRLQRDFKRLINDK